MNGLLNSPEVFLYREAVDFRKSINGLSSLVASDVSLPLSSGALFLFVNRQRDKIKILYWDKTGFALWYKRLEKDKFQWPSKHSEPVLYLNQEALSRLLDGFSIIGHSEIDVTGWRIN